MNGKAREGSSSSERWTDAELLARLRAADPAHTTAPADSWIDELTEATMNHATTESTSDAAADESQRTRRPSRRTTWAVGAAAAALVAAAGIGIVAGRGEAPAPPAAKPDTVMTLNLPAGDAAGMCIQFSVAALKPMDLAFSGTVTAVGTGTATLTPDHWYKGGEGTTSVKLATLGDSVVLEGGIVFEQGKRYLVTATQGTVNACGFSGEWTPGMAAAYAEAFGG